VRARSFAVPSGFSASRWVRMIPTVRSGLNRHREDQNDHDAEQYSMHISSLDSTRQGNSLARSLIALNRWLRGGNREGMGHGSPAMKRLCPSWPRRSHEVTVHADRDQVRVRGGGEADGSIRRSSIAKRLVARSTGSPSARRTPRPTGGMTEPDPAFGALDALVATDRRTSLTAGPTAIVRAGFSDTRRSGWRRDRGPALRSRRGGAA
jgi:hypothetical protein